MVQIRYDDGSTSRHKTFREAMNIANMGGQGVRTATKVSFDDFNGERVRLVRSDDGRHWIHESLDDLIDAVEDLHTN